MTPFNTHTHTLALAQRDKHRDMSTHIHTYTHRLTQTNIVKGTCTNTAIRNTQQLVKCDGDQSLIIRKQAERSVIPHLRAETMSLGIDSNNRIRIVSCSNYQSSIAVK